jgi:phosphoserine phosphatase
MNSEAFISSVLRLSPKVAVFDCDGTLWAPDAGEGFMEWELERGLVSDETARWIRGRYADYKANKVDEDTMCGEMVTMHAGLLEQEVERAAETYFVANIAPWIFPEMQQLVRRLLEQHCDVWAISSTNEWVIRVGIQRFGIARNHVLAAAVAVENGRITDRLLRIPSGDGKGAAIRASIGGQVDAAFGNTKWDVAMLEMARRPFVINPSTDFEKTARQRKWPIYFPDSTRQR